MKKLTKLLLVSMCLALAIAVFAACGNRDTIMVVVRESGSGTRAEFDRNVGIGGVDQPVLSGQIHEITSNGQVITSVAENPLAIGYISAATVDARVRAITIDGHAHTSLNFPIARPFIAAHHNTVELQAFAQDFWNFLGSARAAAAIGLTHTAAVPDADRTNWTPPATRPVGGQILLRGSSSVMPLMQRLVAYYVLHTPAADADFDINMPSTSQGFNNTDGIQSGNNNRTFGFSSADLTTAQAAFSTQLHIAQDAIAVIVHPDSNITNLTLAQVRNIFTGAYERWSDIG